MNVHDTARHTTVVSLTIESRMAVCIRSRHNIHIIAQLQRSTVHVGIKQDAMKIILGR